ncbi:MAG TPA: hypothetical protein VMV99_02835 [Rhodanobacter sp.]|nr:hypothetical protein [Rhodanobacter sp.]
MQIPHDVQTELAKASPSIGAAALTVFGVSLPDIVQITALIYTLGLIAQQVYRLMRWFRQRRDAK